MASAPDRSAIGGGAPGGKARLRLELFLGARGMAGLASSGQGSSQPSPEEARSWASKYASAVAAVSRVRPPPAAPRWRFIGPSVVIDGQSAGWSRSTVSGRVSAVAVDPSNDRHLLVGAAAGGIWESFDAGATWAPRTDDQVTLAIGAIAFDPQAPKTVYAGTGEGDFYYLLGQGLLRSLDGGTTWRLLAAGPFVGEGFFDLVVNPTNGKHLLAATTGGLYLSTDSGRTWALTHPAVVRPWSLTHPFSNWALALQPAGGPTPEVLAGGDDGMFMSNDGGRTWSPLALPGAPSVWDRVDVDYARSNPSVAYIFAVSGSTAFLWRRDPSGAWQSVAPPHDPDPLLDLKVGQGWYHWVVAASPDTDTQVYLGSVDIHRGDMTGRAWTWSTVSTRKRDDSSLPTGTHYSIHADHHAIAFSPTHPGTLYVGCDGGLFRTADRGDTWESLNDGLGITEVDYLADNEVTTRLLVAGTQDNGTIRYTGVTAWQHGNDGDGGDCAADRLDPNTCFGSRWSMGVWRTRAAAAASWPVVPGPTFVQTGPPVPNGYQSLFYPPMGAFGATVAQAGQSVFISRDEGTDWISVEIPPASPPPAQTELATAISFTSADELYVATNNGRVFRLDWMGRAWGAAIGLVRPFPTNPRPGVISDLLVDPANPARLWVTTSDTGKVARSDDGGRTWVDVSPRLGDLPINAVAVDDKNSKRVWIGADIGVYQSVDAGITWRPYSNGLPRLIVSDLAFQSTARLLRAATRNRGVWEIAVGG